MVDDAEEQTPLLRVARIEVKGLFGLYDHRIELKLDERVTILHGPNGVGKTMLLRMVDLVLSGDWGSLYTVPFARFRIGLTDSTLLVIDRELRSSNSAAPKDNGRLRISLERPEQPLFERDVFIVTDNHLTSDEPPQVKAFVAEVNAVLIPIGRLIERLAGERKAEATILRLAKHLANDIKSTHEQYGRRSQELDQSFPKRLLAAGERTEDIDVLKRRMRELDTRRKELEEMGLLDDSPLAPFDVEALDDISTAQQAVLALYANDAADKLAVFADLAKRVRLLLDIINAKFRHKRLRVDRKAGMLIESEKLAGPVIALDALSSGEQHELVLHYVLLSHIRPNTLVLIDEPELSLHVVWQKRFLPDLLRIVAVAGIDVLVATHSPFIIGEHRDLMVGLSDDLP